MAFSIRSFFINDGLKYFIWVGWFGVNVVFFYRTFMYYETDPQFYYLHQMLGYALCVSRASATCIILNSSVLLIPMCKRLITYLRGLTCLTGIHQARRVLDKGKSFHMFCGRLLFFMAVIHCGGHARNAIYFSKYYNSKYQELNVAKYANQNPLMIVVTTVPGVTGLLLLFSLVVIACFSSQRLRRKKHDWFWTTHHIFIIFYLLLFLHSMAGVLKYQINLYEHTPGCFLVTYNTSTPDLVDRIVIPEPEPYAEPFPEPELLMPMKTSNKQALKSKMSDSKVSSKMPRKSMISNTSKEMQKKFSLAQSSTFDMTLSLAETLKAKSSSQSGVEEASMNTSSSIPHYDKLLINGSWLHVKQCDQPRPQFHSCQTEAWKWLSLPLLIYIIERIIRFARSFRVPANIEDVKLHSSDVIELKMSQKSFKAKPGQSVWVRCPSISHVELHPFSLTSAPCKEDPTFGIHVKVAGDWTSVLRDQLLENSVFHTDGYSVEQELQLRSNRTDIDKQANYKRIDANHAVNETGRPLLVEKPNEGLLCDTAERSKTFSKKSLKSLVSTSYSKPAKNSCISVEDDIVTVNTHRRRLDIMRMQNESPFPSLYIEGPVGSAMEDVYKYEVSLCVGGGIGVTPFASVLNSYLKDSNLFNATKLRRLYLVWACKSIESFEWFASLINKLQTKLWDDNLPDFLNVHLYMTGTISENIESNFHNKTVHPSSLQRFRVFMCRPNIEEVLEDISLRHKKNSVGVFCCGPHGLVSSVKTCCMKQRGKCAAKFVFNKESF